MSQQEPKPTWLRIKVPPSSSNRVISAINNKSLHTVCAEAKCPNQMQCFSKGQATFLLLGPSCTRRCTFCAIDKSSVQKPDMNEPACIAHAIDQMGLSYSVLTMVTRDDLADGGASQIIKTMREIRKLSPDTDIELLISDLNGNWDALDMIIQARPAVINHNIETVPRLYPGVRPQADYKRSLCLLTRVSSIRSAIITKSGMMLGLGERKYEILSTMDDLRNAGCQLLTLGQYLSPSHGHHPVISYIPPHEFDEYKKEALDRGFLGVASAPLVRSSYRAADLFLSVRNENES